MALTAAQLKKFKAKLEILRDELSELSNIAADSRKPVELDQTSVGRLSRMDALQGQAMQLETERRREIERIRIDAALERIETGDYGYCTVCDEDIALKRLEHDPSVPNCIDCQRAQN
jgi:DnaK suppressor protein